MKKLKIPLFVVIVSIMMSQIANAQTSSNNNRGLYLTLSDYLHCKLSYSTIQNNPKNTLRLHGFLGQHNIVVITDGKKIILPKSQVFGYRDNGLNYRFFGSVAYQIVDTVGFYLYSFEKLVQQGKGPKSTRVFYFSTKANSELLPLKQEYVDKAFAMQPKFRNVVEAQLRSDEELDAYDAVANEYKIKEIYKESTK